MVWYIMVRYDVALYINGMVHHSGTISTQAHVLRDNFICQPSSVRLSSNIPYKHGEPGGLKALLIGSLSADSLP